MATVKVATLTIVNVLQNPIRERGDLLGVGMTNGGNRSCQLEPLYSHLGLRGLDPGRTKLPCVV